MVNVTRVPCPAGCLFGVDAVGEPCSACRDGREEAQRRSTAPAPKDLRAVLAAVLPYAESRAEDLSEADGDDGPDRSAAAWAAVELGRRALASPPHDHAPPTVLADAAMLLRKSNPATAHRIDRLIRGWLSPAPTTERAAATPEASPGKWPSVMVSGGMAAPLKANCSCGKGVAGHTIGGVAHVSRGACIILTCARPEATPAATPDLTEAELEQWEREAIGAHPGRFTGVVPRLVRALRRARRGE
jgi:hypothetical protein